MAYKGAFLWENPDQDITWIMVDQRNQSLHSGQVPIGSFDAPIDPSDL